MSTDRRECLQCGQTPAEIKTRNTICGIEGGHEYRELEHEWERHRWADWSDKELARAGIKPEVFEKHRRTPVMSLEWVGCNDTRTGHLPATQEAIDDWVASRIGECVHCGHDTTTPSTEDRNRA